MNDNWHRHRNRRTKNFQSRCYKQLRKNLNDPVGPASVASSATGKALNQHLKTRRIEDLPKGKAIVRICGIPVCESEAMDVSGNGTRIIVEKDPMVLMNLRTGQEIELHMVYADTINKAVLQRSEIAQISHQSKDDAFYGYVVVEMKTIATLPIS